MKKLNTLKSIASAFAFALITVTFAWAQDKAEAKEDTLTGEVVDLMCYLDHSAQGEKHMKCATKCIQSGGPVGLLVGDKVYLVIGDHKPMNETLAPLAGQQATLKGKIVERSGMRMIENAELVKK